MGALLEVHHLTKHFEPARRHGKRTGVVRAVDGISFSIAEGETLGLVGESGCGKTTAGRAVLRLIEPTSGVALFHPPARADTSPIAIFDLPKTRLRRLRRHCQMVFQDPYGSLNPRATAGAIVAEPLQVHRLAPKTEIPERVRGLFERVGLNPAHVRRYPHEFSGGQRQRIGLARALAVEPSLIIADEPVSSLDVSIQAQIVNLLQGFKADLGLSYLFVSHDLSVVRHISDRVAVMYLGKIVEVADTQTLYSEPTHPYTRALLSAVPVPDPTVGRNRQVLGGEVPSPTHPPSGCAFHTRCPMAKPECAARTQVLHPISERHAVACHVATGT